MKKLKIILIITIILILILPAFCMAESSSQKIIKDFDAYKGNLGESTKLLPKVQSIAGVIASIGSIISIICLVIIGIKYMLGSVEERAEYKKTMMPYLIGAILIFASVTIANMVYTFASSIK